MMTLVHVMGSHWHWVERDLLAMKYRRDDIGTSELTLWELISIVIAAPTGTAVREVMDSCQMCVIYSQPKWSRTEQLLANFSEQQAGVLQLTGRYPRPGIGASQARSRSTSSGFTPVGGIALDAYSPEEYTRKRSEYMRRNQLAAQRNPEAARKAMKHNVIPKQGAL
jgi:hypothetical protein